MSGEDGNQLLEEWICKYIKMVFTKEAGIEMVLEPSDNNTVNKIRKWALKDNFPHKIIKVFLKCYNAETCSANKFDMLDQFLSSYEINDEETFLQLKKKFNDNYSQMKSSGAHAHGNVFYDDGKNFYLVEDVKRAIIDIKEKFLV